MKRDMDLCRKILVSVEEQATGNNVCYLQFEGYDKKKIEYHCNQLVRAGLMNKRSEYIARPANQDAYIFPGDLTWSGHEFLAGIRQDTVWNKTKDVIAKNGLPMVLDVVKEISQSVITSMVQGVVKGLSQ